MNPTHARTTDAVAGLALQLPRHGWMMATAESCTGGLIAAACTDRAGASHWFDRGFVTYSNIAKSELLGVPMALIQRHGAVSQEVAAAMARGAVQEDPARVSVAVTGVAGPGGGSPDKPVGTVWFGWCVRGEIHTQRMLFPGDRGSVREHTVAHALEQLLSLLPEPGQAGSGMRAPRP